MKSLTKWIYDGVVVIVSCVWLFATPWTAARQASLSFTSSRSLLKLVSLESVMPSNHLISLSPASGSFPMSQLFASGGQRIGASAPAPEAGETADTTMLALKTEAASQGMQAASPSGKRQGH